MFGDNQSSNLKSPLLYTSVGSYNATFVFKTKAVHGRKPKSTPSTSATIPTLPIITVNNVVIEDNLTLLTGQRILFSAGRTIDNVPIDNLDFQWNWGDGTQSGGIGVYAQQHEWDEIDGESQTFNLTLTVSDGINVGMKTILVHINNRIPVQVFV